ncbi:alpha/beta fold hydrolase [Ornithinimicrobium sp. Y1694]|uniref:alpha/beta fold hydrolase n=1 Tax=Ornithinimicrobium sp. Y1694 TaxID=3418590 RepID=UPI003CEA0671
MESSFAQPRLILLHGTRMNARQWQPYRTLLGDLRLHAVDLPGHGERAGEEFTRSSALATVEDAVRRATLEDGVLPVLAGHSLGGYVGALWAAEHPCDLSALVLIGATADPAGPLTAVYRGFARVLPHLNAERTARGMNALFRGLGAKGEYAEALPDGSGYAALPDAWRLVIDECGPDLLQEVACPVWMVNGQLDQMRLHVRRFAAAAREPRVVTVRKATHLMPATHPEQVAAALRLAVAGTR